MTHYIQRLSQIISGKRARGKSIAAEHADVPPIDLRELAELVPLLRKRLALGSLSDDALLASLVAIARHPTDEARWYAAETSTLGQQLAVESEDLHRDLVTLISLLPQPYL